MSCAGSADAWQAALQAIVDLVHCNAADLPAYPATPFPWARSLHQPVAADAAAGAAMCRHLSLLVQVRPGYVCTSRAQAYGARHGWLVEAAQIQRADRLLACSCGQEWQMRC